MFGLSWRNCCSPARFIFSRVFFSRVVISVISGVFLYANISILANQVFAHIHGRYLFFVPAPMFDLFITFPVFSSVEQSNRELIVEGRRTGLTEETPQWVELPVDEYFPFRLGETLARINLSKFLDYFGEPGLEEAYLFLILKIRERYNHDHPNELIDILRFSVDEWPRSYKDFYSEKTPEQTQRHILVTEEDEL